MDCIRNPKPNIIDNNIIVIEIVGIGKFIIYYTYTLHAKAHGEMIVKSFKCFREEHNTIIIDELRIVNKYLLINVYFDVFINILYNTVHKFAINLYIVFLSCISNYTIQIILD